MDERPMLALEFDPVQISSKHKIIQALHDIVSFVGLDEIRAIDRAALERRNIYDVVGPNKMPQHFFYMFAVHRDFFCRMSS